MKLKNTPEDFRVREKFPLDSFLKYSGNYHIYLLKKQNLSTPQAITLLSRASKLPEKSFGFAGNKDKIAITQQYISVKGKRIDNIKIKNLAIEYKGASNTPISMGDNEGNEFNIFIRDISPHELSNFLSKIRRKQLKKIKIKKILFPNLFGQQRFSSDNAQIGKLLIKKQFKKALNLILKHDGSYEKELKAKFQSNPTDPIGCLRLIPKKTLRIFVHAYQSYLFNTMLKNLINKIEKNKINNKAKTTLPIIGFATPETKEIKNLLKKENITLRDFIIPQIPELSSEGSERKAFEQCENFKIIEIKKQETTADIKASFFLPKGCYATELVKYLFS